MPTFSPGFNDGAWDIPGWTAQNPVYPTFSSLPAPLDVPYAIIQGSFLSISGQGENGFVTCTPSVRQYNWNDTRIELDQIKVQIPQSGQVLFNIPVGNVGTLPTSWTWDIRLRVGPSTSDYPAMALTQGQLLDLSTLGP